jgi:hypothetical protein
MVDGKPPLTPADSFYIGQNIPTLSEDELLQLGQKYFLPKHFFQYVLSFVTIASFPSGCPHIAKAQRERERERERRSGGFQTHLAEKRSWSPCFDFQADSTEELEPLFDYSRVQSFDVVCLDCEFRFLLESLQRSFFLLFFALFFRKSPQCFPLSFFFSLDIKSTVCGGGHDNEAGRERKKKEVGRGERNDEFFSNI